jgi:hypothetical protein
MLKLYLLSDSEAALICAALIGMGTLTSKTNRTTSKQCYTLASTIEEIKEGPGDWVDEARRAFIGTKRFDRSPMGIYRLPDGHLQDVEPAADGRRRGDVHGSGVHMVR